MEWLTIQGAKPWDGRYELDLLENELTTREWGYVKRLTGYMPLTIMNGLEGADPELFTALAVIALRRAGKIEQAAVTDTYERLLDTPAGRIMLESDTDVDEAEADAGPPAVSSNGSDSFSGTGSTPSSERSDGPIPPATGIPASATSTSAPVRSVI